MKLNCQGQLKSKMQLNDKGHLNKKGKLVRKSGDVLIGIPAEGREVSIFIPHGKELNSRGQLSNCFFTIELSPMKNA